MFFNGNHQKLRLLRVARNDEVILIPGGWFVGGFAANKPPSLLTPNNIVIANEEKQSIRRLRNFPVNIKCSLKEICISDLLNVLLYNSFHKPGY